MTDPQFIKACPKCGQPLRILTNRTTGREFVGCSRWLPDGSGCNHTEPVPESYRLRQQGVRDMFDDVELGQ